MKKEGTDMAGTGRSTEDAYGPAVMEFIAAGGELTLIEGGEGSYSGFPQS